MSCFPCFSKADQNTASNVNGTARVENDRSFDPTRAETTPPTPAPPFKVKGNDPPRDPSKSGADDRGSGNISAKSITYSELVKATNNFQPQCLVGEGGFGRVYRGRLENGGQVVAVKQLDKNGIQGNNEFLVEVLTLSLLHHPNLVTLIGYCAEGDERLLVYEFMQMGSVECHLFDVSAEQEPLNWHRRMKVATGSAQGLEYLHEKANPPVIYRDLKLSNILLDDDFNPKLSDFGLAKLGCVGDNAQVSSRVMGTYGYCAPEYAKTGELTLKSDVYSFGVVLLELISGRRAIDPCKPANEQNLVSWAQLMFKDQKRFPELADPLLEGKYPVRGLNQAVGVAAMCLQEDPIVRPMMADVVTALSFLPMDADQDLGNGSGGSQPPPLL